MNILKGISVELQTTFAVVAVAGEMATQAKITGWQTGTALNAVAKVFQHWLSGFEHVGDYENREIIAHVKAFFEANESSRFEAITPDADNIERVVNRVSAIGRSKRMKEDFLCIA